MTDVIAHRGASRAEPENTRAAFERAVEMGADAIELDVRFSADRALVVHHDARLADGRAIVDLRADQLPPELPSLAEALDACQPVVVNLELKNSPDDPDFDAADTIADAVVELLAGRPEPRARWLLSSFRMETIDRVRDLAPDLATAFLVSFSGLDAVAATVAHGHGTLHPWCATLEHHVVEAAAAAGLRVNTWTCNDPDRARELAAWGVDGIVTDVPDEIRSALGRSTPA